MDRWKSWKKKARKQARLGWRDATARLDRLREETAPQREQLGREARRRTPQLLALLLATAREMSRNYPTERVSPPRKRALRALKVLLAAGAVFVAYRLLRARRR